MIDQAVHASQLPRAVHAAIADVRASQPFEPVVVWVQSGEGARSLSRAVAREHSMFDVSFMQTRHLAERLLTHAGVGLPGASMDDAMAGELVRKVAVGARGPLQDAVSPALVAELGRAFRQLRSATEVELEGYDDAGPLAREVVRLYRLYVVEAAGMADRADVLRAAIAAVDSASPLVVRVVAVAAGTESGTVDGDPLEEELATELLRAGRLRTIAVDYDVASAKHDSRVVKVLTDPATEARSVVAQLLEWADAGENFGSMAVAHMQHDSYASELEMALDEAAIPWRARHSKLVGGDAVLGFTAAIAHFVGGPKNVPELLRLAGSAPLLVASGEASLVPLHEWTGWVRRARAGSDVHALVDRLRLFDQPVAASFFERLHSDGCKTHATWQGWCDWLTEMFDTYFDFGCLGPDLVETQRERLRFVDRRLRRLDNVGLPVGPEWFAAGLLDSVVAAAARRSQGASVLLCPIGDAAGLVADNVVICGMSGDATPRVSPILDAVRPPGAPTQMQRDQAIVEQLMSTSRRVCLTSARVDSRLAREVAPSPVLLSVLAAWEGRPVAVEEVLSGAAFDWLTVIPSFAASIWDGSVSPSRRLDRLRSLGMTPTDDELLSQAGIATQSLASVRAKQSNVLTAFDGLAGETRLPSETSPTRLEHYATCPRRYFFASTLRVGDQEDETDPWQLTSLDKGRLVHDVLEKFVAGHAHLVANGEPWPNDARQRLASMLLEELSDARRDGRLPGGLLARWESEALVEQLQRALTLDDEARRQGGVAPFAAGIELRFGGNSGSPPVRVQLDDGRSIAFEGRIDRVDRSADGSFVRAIDYKTGKASSKSGIRKDIVDGARQLQPGVYAAHLAAQFPGARIQTGLWMLREDELDDAWLFHDWDDEARERFEDVVRRIGDQVHSGIFPAVPGDDDHLNPGSQEHCTYCPFDAVCPTDRADAWERKNSDPVLVAFHGLKEAPQ